MTRKINLNRTQLDFLCHLPEIKDPSESVDLSAAAPTRQITKTDDDGQAKKSQLVKVSNFTFSEVDRLDDESKVDRLKSELLFREYKGKIHFFVDIFFLA